MGSSSDKLAFNQRPNFDLLRTIPADLVVRFIESVIPVQKRDNLLSVVVKSDVPEVPTRRAFQKLVKYLPRTMRRTVSDPLSSQRAVFEAEIKSRKWVFGVCN